MNATPESSQLTVSGPTHRPPVQNRSRKVLERILDATEELLETQTFDELTVREILRRSRVSTGSFYARFKTKDDVLRELYRRYWDEMRGLDTKQLEKQVEKLGLRELMELIVRLALERMERRRGLLRTITIHMRLHPSANSDEERELVRRTRDAGVALILSRAEKMGHPRPREAARLVSFTLAALVREYALFSYTPHASQLGIGRQRFIEQTARMMSDYLQAPDT